jgi:carbamoyl-phosphate synthase large subunit
VKEEGVEVVLVNPNVATIQTDERFVEEVIEKEESDGVLLGFGGQTALNCGVELSERGVLERHGVRVLGTSVEAIERADDRELFRETMVAAGIPVPKSGKASSLEEALRVAIEIGDPVMVSVAYTLGGQGTGVTRDEGDFRRIAPIGFAHSMIHQILIENGSVGLIVNTPSPGNIQAVSDGNLMRRKAVEYRVPMITNLELANTLANIITEHRMISSLLACAQAR